MSTISWTEHGTRRTGRWHSENGTPPPARVVVADDRTSAAAALRLARSGTALLWRGDFHNAGNLLRAMGRRLPAPARATPDDLGAHFHAHRRARARRAALLGKVVVAVERDHSVRLRRAPDVRAACRHAYGHLAGEPGAATDTPTVVIDLVARSPLPPGVDHPVVFDIGTGTGVLAAVLAQRGAADVRATDLNPRAVRCARSNLRRLGLEDRVHVTEADLWPAVPAHADLIVCNPPWLPGHPTSALELGVYDPGSAVLDRFLTGLADHLTPQGEGWLILSDLAERLGLRPPDDLRARIAAAGLTVVGRAETAPRHPRSTDRADPFHAARSRERTVLWRLRPATP
ncbi:class I SAM-dependent methyltransferase [Nocardia farcinica]|uniref:methyltransferase n=1 Tax=Nocardia farcinica TaxID=37329 RepID=UPI0018944A8E|nr:class I SAM-dependent methyltransferase [Nocardia farcinica]MBF6261034.1 class I SAM-dependent methyltransferase [Nocardia farcinica]MBF6279298.1 class I SAM-dependent methyltransferase [Nocardia farcinica]MBF6304044.1 class I SAM-dependent methyltransferase [Nocardia farcinica]MBF6389086.1 class I SAM-dependent methyltransferase [Nocardia farcinica]MBF6491695.1 class I SAM-dependent methyltransferase [Nocardia farcinica]